VTAGMRELVCMCVCVCVFVCVCVCERERAIIGMHDDACDCRYQRERERGCVRDKERGVGVRERDRKE